MTICFNSQLFAAICYNATYFWVFQTPISMMLVGNGCKKIKEHDEINLHHADALNVIFSRNS